MTRLSVQLIMALSPGTRLGHYDVTALLGEGGMGQVWQATDTQLNRQVALKILPDAFAADPDRLARFTREAQILASLNHPNIAQIHGIEEAEGTRALVLELVEGPTLADRIAKGPIPLDEALPIAKQIAEALEAAHEAGVIHRDLKPANIKVRDDGTVKVLDFGLAKALDPAPDVDPSQSPTLTAAATQMGVIMGTAAYMSPEQAKGKTVDRRADVWAFGAVLYEMLAGRRAFVGADVSDTLVSVFRDDPDWSRLSSDVPARVRQTVQVCLQKDPEQRVRDVAAVRLAMEGAFETIAATPSDTVVAPPLQLWQQPVAALGVPVVAVLVTAVAVWSLTRPDVVPADVMRFVIPPPDAAPFDFGGNYPDLAMTADGTQVIYQARAPGGGRQLHLRPLDQFVGAPLRGGEGGEAPFVSPDGEWVGFVDGIDNTILRRVSIFGGPPVTLAEFPGIIAGASWGADDQIIVGTLGGGLFRVSGGGGEPEVLTTLDADQGELGHFLPAIIPGRPAVLFEIWLGEVATAQLAVLDLDTGTVTRLGLGGVSPHYVSTGHIVYAAEDGSLRAVPFDADSLQVTGTPVPLVEGVMVKGSGPANFRISDQGALVYVRGARPSNDRTLALVGHDGVVEPLEVPPAEYLSPRVSPDGGKLVVQTAEDEGGVLWVYDLSGDTQIQQLTFEGDSQRPVWTPDGQRITFSSDRDGTMSLYGVPADGSGVPERLTTADDGTLHWPQSWSPDGQTLLFNVQTGLNVPTGPGWDIWTLSASDRETQRLHDTPDTFYLGAELSPNGEWLAYGEGPAPAAVDVYVEPFPPTGAKRRISQNGGYWPLWSPDGGRLFYRPSATNAGITLRSVDVVTDPDFAFRNEQTLPIEGFTVVPYHRDYDITPDGERLIMVFPADQTESGEAFPPQINIVLNWFEELNARVPVN